MTQTLIPLALAGLLHFVQFAVASVMANLDLGSDYTSGSRDTPPPREMRPVTARMMRAYSNHMEMFPFFAAAVLLITVTAQETTVTAAAAWVYLAARVLYVPAYAFGWNPWRSLVWMIAMVATIALYIAALV